MDHGQIDSRARDEYRWYCASTNFIDRHGNPTPGWDALPEQIRTAWTTFVRAASPEYLAGPPGGGDLPGLASTSCSSALPDRS